ncbi:hypothetical protein [Mucilaginibacter psychrotolerans]|uniref:Uncharacterized protein n=1 Tax=Mucilaginibacter psychrotolerans TaxID=1524096 RepID=A0A4Y8S7H2_9SPHI|nr:hypothetical protein [Mucilaginibacter psychrotolerans]TFF34973.1 hypothetical protein E2R66_20610 [Mucilaginibacter psychrotolerans]
MKLREIAIFTAYQHQYQSIFNPQTWCIQEQYWRYLGAYDTGPFAKITIRVNDDPVMKYKDFALDNTCLTVVGIDKYLDVANFLGSSSTKKKTALVNLLHDGMLFLCDHYLWDKEPLVRAYELCLENNLEYKFKLRDKTYRSPQRNWYGAIYCDWDLHYFKATARIEDINGELIKEQELLNIEPYFGEFIYYAKSKWDDAYTFSLYSKTGEKWSIRLMTLVVNE